MSQKSVWTALTGGKLAAATIFAVLATDAGSEIVSFKSTEETVLDEVRKVEELPNFKSWVGYEATRLPAFYADYSGADRQAA